MINTILKDVANGTCPAYDRSFNGQWLYKIYKGKKQMYSHDETMPGVTVFFKSHYGPETTIVYCDNLKRAYEIVEYQEKNRIAIHDAQQKLGEYIRKTKMY
jgi:hypothetical protein